MKIRFFILVQLLIGCTFLFGYWLDSSTEDIVLSSGSSIEIPFNVEPGALPEGSYNSRIRLRDSEGGFLEIPVTLTVNTALLNTPQNPDITVDNDSLLITWDMVEGANYYQVYSSLNPINNFQETALTSNTYLRLPIPVTETKVFYQIVAFQTVRGNEIKKTSSPIIISYPVEDAFERSFTATDPPLGEIRNIAEFEPMAAVLIRYPFGIPLSLIAEMSQEIIVITLVDDQNDQDYVINQYNSNSVNLSNCQFLQADTDSYWTRDFGPWFIANNGGLAVVNFPYNRPRPNDNDIPIEIAEYMNLPLFGMNLTHTGGNYMTDGYGISASSDLVLEENPDLDSNDVDLLVSDYLGVDQYHLIPDPNNTYIDHIDCWGKFLAPDKVLIRSVPTSHAQYDEIEEVAVYFQNQISSYGTNYQVFRIYTPNDQPYTNSLILNNRVFVPQTYSHYDDDALSTYEEAMPGYDIIGVYGSWESTDALHCRTHEIPDMDMLEIRHIPDPETNPTNLQRLIEVELTTFDNSELVEDSLQVFYRINTGNFQSEPLLNLDNNSYQTLLPYFSSGSTIDYYIKALNSNGKRCFEPYIGSGDPHSFIVTSGVTTDLLAVPESFQIQLNQNSSNNINLQLVNSSVETLTISVTIINEGADN